MEISLEDLTNKLKLRINSSAGNLNCKFYDNKIGLEFKNGDDDYRIVLFQPDTNNSESYQVRYYGNTQSIHNTFLDQSNIKLQKEIESSLVLKRLKELADINKNHIGLLHLTANNILYEDGAKALEFFVDLFSTEIPHS